jgi:hypothetical protein
LALLPFRATLHVVPKLAPAIWQAGIFAYFSIKEGLQALAAAAYALLRRASSYFVPHFRVNLGGARR